MFRFIHPGPNVIALPFPMRPRRVVYGELARVLDFIQWKQRMTKTNGESNGEENDILNLPEADQKLWLIQKMFEVLKDADAQDLEALYRVLTKKDKPPEGA